MIEQLTYRLDQFEGPLDLLLTLISKNKGSITDIPIALICDQYMEYLAEAERMDLEVASEFIVMASELMLIKSKMILPHEEGTENDPRREIADALLLYQDGESGLFCVAMSLGGVLPWSSEGKSALCAVSIAV